MSFQANKIRQLWFPFTILAIIVLTIGWILAGVIYPNSVQGNSLDPTIESTPTGTASPTKSPITTKPAEPSATPTLLQPTETSSANCTYSSYYWGTNTNAWQIENIVLGNLSFTKVEAIDILTKEQPTPTEQLMGQFFTALLNNLNGANSGEIDTIMVEVRDWLILNPHGVDLTESEHQEIQKYTEQLQDYNLGITGPGLCSDESLTPTPAATQTQTFTATYTQGTFIPSFTPTPTKRSGSRPKPTNTQPPTQLTNTPQPNPTDAPISTPTSVVPPTDAPTIPPPTSPSTTQPTSISTQPPPITIP